MTNRPQPNTRSQKVVSRIRMMRLARGWSAQHLANVMTEQGHRISRATIAKFECGARRLVTIDDLWAFARAFQVPTDQLLDDGPACLVCNNAPPAGFACLNCGAQPVRHDQPAGGA
jgi:transcriptional regulator with XRE-family HTH domain